MCECFIVFRTKPRIPVQQAVLIKNLTWCEVRKVTNIGQCYKAQDSNVMCKYFIVFTTKLRISVLQAVLIINMTWYHG